MIYFPFLYPTLTSSLIYILFIVYYKLIISQNARLTAPSELIRREAIAKRLNQREPVRQQLLVPVRSHRLRCGLRVILALPLHGLRIRLVVRSHLFYHPPTIRPAHPLLIDRLGANSPIEHAFHIRPY